MDTSNDRTNADRSATVARTEPGHAHHGQHGMNTGRSTVVGVFENRPQADEAVAELHRAGFRDDQIGVARRGEESTGGMSAGANRAATGPEGAGMHAGETGDEATTGAGAERGAVTGAVTGGVIAALGALLIPGIGPVIAGGILATALGGLIVGGVAGGILGALMHLGVPEEEAQYYEGEFKSGRTLVTVKADGRATEAEEILRRFGAYDVNNRPGMGSDQVMTGQTVNRPVPGREKTREGVQTVELREEELRANKRSVQAGEVQVGKEVVTEKRTIEVPVTHEEAVIERHPVDRRPSEQPIRENETIRVPLREEQINVQKVPVVTEEVTVGKRQVQENQTVSDTVRHEEARIENTGTTNAGSTARTTGGWDEAMPRYRSDWQQRYGSQGGRWEDYEPGYRYGHEMSNDPRYRGRSWSEVEPELRSDWGSRYHDRPWDRFTASIRHAWDGVAGSSR